MTGLLRYARGVIDPLGKNAKHTFAASHALVDYTTGAVFTFIPKNACTTLRYSLALQNGVIAGPEDFTWIHANNGTFSAGLAELVRAPVSLVILRCPFQRLASAFLDKFVNYDRDAWDFRRRMGDAFELPDLTFRDFAMAVVATPKMLRANIHWRPQVDFLVYEDYTHWIGLSDLSSRIDLIAAETGLRLHDTRDLMRHDLRRIAECKQKRPRPTPLRDLHALMLEGRAPSHASVYDAALVSAVAEAYSADIALVAEKCGPGAVTMGAAGGETPKA